VQSPVPCEITSLQEHQSYTVSRAWWLTPVTPATGEAEIRRIVVRGQPGQLVLHVFAVPSSWPLVTLLPQVTSSGPLTWLWRKVLIGRGCVLIVIIIVILHDPLQRQGESGRSHPFLHPSGPGSGLSSLRWGH
jgi:hypothetical protein